MKKRQKCRKVNDINLHQLSAVLTALKSLTNIFSWLRQIRTFFLLSNYGDNLTEHLKFSKQK